ncbi:hypothetical protein [Streptomyces sp. NPDC002788]
MTADPYAPSSAPTPSAAAHRPHREITDSHGRVRLVGETDRDIVGPARTVG